MLLGNRKFNEKDTVMFAKCIRSLLTHTFIVKQEDEALYSLLSYSDHLVMAEEYLYAMGYALEYDKDLGVVMLVTHPEFEEVEGFRKMNRCQFGKNEINLLIILWQVYFEFYGVHNEVMTTVSYIVDKLKDYGIRMSQTELMSAMKRLKSFKIINYKIWDKKNQRNEEIRVIIYPSVTFCFKMDELKAIMEEELEYLETGTKKTTKKTEIEYDFGNDNITEEEFEEAFDE